MYNAWGCIKSLFLAKSAKIFAIPKVFGTQS